MRLLLQRVSSAAVRVGEETVGEIGKGLLVFAAAVAGDGLEQVAAAVAKLAALRVFADEQGRMNLDARQAGGAFLVVSQFTLAASLDRGRRPSFDGAAPPAVAEPLIDALADGLRAEGFKVASGRFGAVMAVELVNDGPVTLVLDLPPPIPK